ncbi:MAG: hypothetical protein Q9198_011105, partial [Flavoplaca austrocitrina]
TVSVRLTHDFSDVSASGRPYEHDLMGRFDSGMPSYDFLREAQGIAHSSTPMDDLIDTEAFSGDVLDFGVDFDFDPSRFFDCELQILCGDQQRLPVGNVHSTELDSSRSGTATPGLKGKLNIGASARAFKESLWLWTPGEGDHAALEQGNLSLPWNSTSTDDRNVSEPPPVNQRVNSFARGRVLAMVLRTCESAIYSHVVSNFPSAELLTKLIHNFITFHSRSELPFIHPATIEVNKERPEFLSGMIAYGATISQDPEIRKLGYAIQEAVRVALPGEVMPSRLLESLMLSHISLNEIIDRSVSSDFYNALPYIWT